MSLYKAMGGIAALGACLLALSYPFRNDEHGVGWVLGGVGWFGFWVCVLALVGTTLVALGRGLYRRASRA